MLNIIKIIIINQIYKFFRIRRKPNIIQLPITSRCNSRCVTCNVWKQNTKVDIPAAELKKVLSDPFFSKVILIGINGGELTLVKDIEGIIEAVLSVKSLQHIHVISNGLLPERLLDLLKNLKEKANKRGVKLGFTLSVDGYGKIHEITRGVPNCFHKTLQLLDEFKENSNVYCDNFNIGCTISTTNIPYIKQIEEFLKGYPFKVYYHLAVPNKRIHTFDEADYYVLNRHRERLLATEFFQSQFYNISLRENPLEKFRAFANYKFLESNGSKRLAQCNYLYQDITIDENLNMSYCATASDTIGSLKDSTPLRLIRSSKGKKTLANVRKCCSSCVHYSDFPTISGAKAFLFALIKERFSMSKFKPQKK